MPFDDPPVSDSTAEAWAAWHRLRTPEWGQAAPWRGRPMRAVRRPSSVAMVEFGLAARRQSTPMRVRPIDPCRAHCRPYGLTALAGGESEALTERAGTRASLRFVPPVPFAIIQG